MARTRKIDVLVEQLARVEQLVDKLDRRLEKIELVTVIREPNSGLAADAYNGLRKQVIAAVTERNAHLHQLAQFDTALRGEASAEHLTASVRGWLAQAGVEVLDDPSVQEAFEFVGEPQGPNVRVVRPAYVDSATGRVIQTGVAERLAAAPSPEQANDGQQPVSDSASAVADAGPAVDAGEIVIDPETAPAVGSAGSTDAIAAAESSDPPSPDSPNETSSPSDEE